MEADNVMKPIATVTGLYRGKFGGLEPLTPDKPLTHDEVRRNPIFYELDLHPEQGDENLIIDLIYDKMSPMRLQDLYRGTDIPEGVRFWPNWSTSRHIWRCMMLTGAGFTREHLVSIRSRSARAGASLRRWAGSGISAREWRVYKPAFEIRIAESIDV